MSHATCSQKVPCARCPWRRDADPAYWHPEEFARMAAGVAGSDGMPGLNTMLCHKSPSVRPEHERPAASERSPLSGTLSEPALCAGYVAVMGYDSLGLRLYAMTTGIDPTEEITDGGLSLYGSLAEMVEAVCEANGLDTLDSRSRT